MYLIVWQMKQQEQNKTLYLHKEGKVGAVLWTWSQSVVPNDVPRDFGPVIAFGTKLQIPVARH